MSRCLPGTARACSAAVQRLFHRDWLLPVLQLKDRKGRGCGSCRCPHPRGYSQGEGFTVWPLTTNSKCTSATPRSFVATSDDGHAVDEAFLQGDASGDAQQPTIRRAGKCTPRRTLAHAVSLGPDAVRSMNSPHWLHWSGPWLIPEPPLQGRIEPTRQHCCGNPAMLTKTHVVSRTRLHQPASQ
ncbi:MAG: hypothetical protein JWM61_87 [Micrococcaceae bacterium]|nr:hypothetical protein [Micrococcaceae bacterium]